MIHIIKQCEVNSIDLNYIRAILDLNKVAIKRNNYYIVEASTFFDMAISSLLQTINFSQEKYQEECKETIILKRLEYTSKYSLTMLTFKS